MPDDKKLSIIQEMARSQCATGGPAHDFSHVLRVTENARRIILSEKAEAMVVLPAALLHEWINLPKDHPDSARSGVLCAQEVTKVLQKIDYPEELIIPIARCIAEHPFSLGVIPATLEGRVLQDADRLDAIGAIGIARCFAVSGELRRPIMHPRDPFCRDRRPADKEYGLDHFYTKLLRIPEELHTETARSMAQDRLSFLRAFLTQLGREVGVSEAAP